ncbi:MAG TPA: phenylalanine--tRNA ligase beta subunit-related protein [Myxococcaceae bacterium]|nr:phenylalanine--tRNA ligase beta subunit-related protein [Myxococcaceae bacterium]
MELTVVPHPLLALRAFVTQFPEPLGKLPRDVYRDLLAPGARGPVQGSEEARPAIRDLLRHGGYKPTGRGKPASEYLVRAASEGKLAGINPAVDVGNVVSLHSGLPISVVDVDRLRAPVRVDLAPAGTRYVFNASGQEIDLEGLLCLFDAEGPCANAVKDSVRTKTSDATTTTLTLVWGAQATGDLVEMAVGWAWELLGRVGATVDLVELTPATSTSR